MKPQGLRIRPLPGPINGDGVALTSMAHPEPTHLNVYAYKGETITCENGHPICDFARTVKIGEIQNGTDDLTDWRQPIPVVGTFPVPGCAICGARWSDGVVFHVGNSWRDPCANLTETLPPHYQK